MPEEFKPGCQSPPIKKMNEADISAESVVKEEKKPMIKVGTPAPDFTARAFHQGKFKNIGLSELKGKWVILCFYPGDFTFV